MLKLNSVFIFTLNISQFSIYLSFCWMFCFVLTGIIMEKLCIWTQSALLILLPCYLLFSSIWHRWVHFSFNILALGYCDKALCASNLVLLPSQLLLLFHILLFLLLFSKSRYLWTFWFFFYLPLQLFYASVNNFQIVCITILRDLANTICLVDGTIYCL